MCSLHAHLYTPCGTTGLPHGATAGHRVGSGRAPPRTSVESERVSLAAWRKFPFSLGYWPSARSGTTPLACDEPICSLTGILARGVPLT